MSNELLTLRASSLPNAFRCPASIRKGKILMNSSNVAASNGTAMHEVLRSLPASGKIDWDRIPEIASLYGADPVETRMLVAMGTKLWNQVEPSFRGAQTEVPLEYEVMPGVILTGHADLIAVSENSLRVGDWKGGRKDNNHAHQFRAYGAMALLSSDDYQEVTSTGLWVRDQEIENYTMSRADARGWLKSLVDEVLNWDGVYHPGETQCAHCPRSHECEAANALVRRDIAAITDTSIVARLECELADMPPDEVVAAFQKANLIVKYAERVRDAIKAHIERNGELVGNGARLFITTQEKRELDPLATWPILEQLGFKDEDLARVMKLKISEIEKVLRERAPRGEKKRAVEQLSELLTAGSAIVKTQTNILNERRT